MPEAADHEREAADHGRAPEDLRVLPRSWSRAQVEGYMEQEIAPGLGVKCGFCHQDEDRAADHAHKEMARDMIRMTRALDQRFFGGRDELTCVTCHQGKEQPHTHMADRTLGFRKVQALSRSSGKRELKRFMRGMSKALGVRCRFCHDMDDMSADTPNKQTARRMMRMVDAINARHLKRHGWRVTCSTCHRGRKRPPR